MCDYNEIACHRGKVINIKTDFDFKNMDIKY